MKMLLLGIVVFCAVAAFASIAWRHSPSTRSAPAILVTVGNPMFSFSGHVAAVEGRTDYDSFLLPLGRTNTCMVNPTYEVVRLANNDYALKAKFRIDYGINDDRGVTYTELTLPVYKSQPNEKSWSKLTPQLSAVAYLDGTQANY
jgi:hypothetical protein